MNITLLGAGAWGTALAIVLAKQHAVLLWGRDAEAIARADAERENSTHLPGFTLPASLALTSDFPQAVAHAADGLLIVATSVSGLRPVLTKASKKAAHFCRTRALSKCWATAYHAVRYQAPLLRRKSCVVCRVR